MGLCEAFKNGRKFVGRNADAGITHGKSYRTGRREVGVPGDPHCDGPAVGEFDGVADEVDEDLVEAMGVSDQGTRDVWREVTGQLETFFIGPHGKNLDRLFNQVVQVEVD